MIQEGFFKDLLVVELAGALAGPVVGLFFAELGARVVKIENRNTGGDVTRNWKHQSEKKGDPYSAYYYSANWGKEILMVNLKDEEERQSVLDLIKKADIVVSNFKSGSAEKFGLDYTSLKKLNPGLIYANVTAYGAEDPRPGFDAALQAETGWMSINGPQDGTHTKVGVAIVDILTGHQLKEGVLVALLHKARTGKGSKVEVSLYDSSISNLSYQAAYYLNLGVIPKPGGSEHPSIAPYGDVVQTSDGQKYLLAIGTEGQFENLCIAIKRSELSKDSRFKTNPQRLGNRKALMAELNETIRKLSKDEFEESCTNEGVPIGPVQNLEQVFQNKNAQELILEEELPDGRVTKRVKTVVFRLSQ